MLLLNTCELLELGCSEH